MSALFFDIDGTILSEITHKIPESALEALHKAQENGHKTFINTGRTICSVPPMIKRISFDGFLCGCGTHLIYGEQVVFHHSIPYERGREIIKSMKDCKVEGFLEGTEDIYYSNRISRLEPVESSRRYMAGLGLAEYKKEQNPKGADLVGVNMEGPFISPVKKGAQDERNIMPCDTEICQRFIDASEGLVKFVGLAPEESDEAVAFVKAMKDKVNISLAHTNADYAHAKAAFDAGANHAVHLFNAMPAFTHREPGVVGAVSDSEHVMAEIICDGVHIHPSMVRAAFKMMGADRMILISDSMRATGMPDGQYTLGGLDVKVVGNHATLVSDGALAGSVTNLADCLRTVVKKMEIPLETALACATINPAKSLGIEDTYGSIAPGKKANIVLLDENLELKMVIKDGQEL